MCSLLYASYISVSKHNLRMPRVFWVLFGKWKASGICVLFVLQFKRRTFGFGAAQLKQSRLCMSWHAQRTFRTRFRLHLVCCVIAVEKFRAELEFQILEWRDNEWKNCPCSPVVFSCHAAIKHWCKSLVFCELGWKAEQARAWSRDEDMRIVRGSMAKDWKSHLVLRRGLT